MFSFLCVFGPAAISLLVMRHLMGEGAKSWYETLLELICLASLNTAAILVCSALLGQGALNTLSNGSKEVYYSALLFLLSLPVGAVCGVVVAAVRKRVKLHIEIEPRKKAGKDEAE